MARTQSRVTPKRNKIFISWSGSNSKEIAKALKRILEGSVFANNDFECFVSDLDIVSGADWWEKIKKELRACKLGLICITKENLRAPWIYFEAGAMIARDVKTIPLLINCSVEALSTTPLSRKQAVDFYDQKKFLQMIVDINKAMNFNLAEAQLNMLGKEAYIELKKELEPVLSRLRDMRVFNDKYVYPRDVTYVKRNTIYVSAPMSSINAHEYDDLRNCMISIKDQLIRMGFNDVHCPMIDIDNPDHFDGKAKAIKDNFPLMKETDSLLVVYPWKNASSSLVEIGYGIALSKRMVVFHREGLPYIMDEAASSIANIRTYSFSSFDEICPLIAKNGMALFEGGLDEKE